ncbi:MAG: ABC transporter ATP-binding protein [Candidatus Goldiibacteriota bacterium]
MSPELVPAISLKNLTVDYSLEGGEALHALRSINLDIMKGESAAIVGESGCGKSTLAYSLLKLGAANSKTSGVIRINGFDIKSATKEELRIIRGGAASMIFQDPAASLNPLFSVREQLAEAILAHAAPRPEREPMEGAALSLLKAAGLEDTSRIMDSYPHQLSGGQQQRVMIAIALSCSPGILVADEPTTALDVTVQAQIVKLLVKIKKERGLTLLLITHDLNLAAELCPRVVVMYAGEIMEDGAISSIVDAIHPYTRALFGVIPGINSGLREFKVIKGSVPDLRRTAPGCPFEPRCSRAREKCLRIHPEIENGVRCFFPYKRGDSV